VGTVNGIRFKNFTKKEVRLLNKNVVIFAFFLFLAFILWYLNALGKEIETDIRYSVRFINPPKGRVIPEDNQLKLMLEVRGQGYSLLKHKIGVDKTSLVVDLSKTPCRRLPDSDPPVYYLLSGSLMSNFKKQIGSGFQLLAIKPDTLSVALNVAGDSPEKGRTEKKSK
jgi:hypothetical protein